MRHGDMRWKFAGPPFGHGGPPFGHGGPPFGPGGPMFGGGRGRRRRGDVRAALLMLLADEPRNGYQLMQAIEELSGGRWRPSPGSIYPTLAQLEDQGLISAAERDGNKVFEITGAGREHVAEHHADSPPWEEPDEPTARSARELRALIGAVAGAAWQVGQAGNEEQRRQAAETLADTRRRLYLILAEDGHPAGEGDA
jgi:DNA-binding PadR family transcriptional regulator